MRVLIVVKTYPQPANKGIEVSCVQAISDGGEWIRLFPVPFRLLQGRQQFKRYQWIEVDAIKAKDPRPESFHIDPDSIRILSDTVPTSNKWEQRKAIIDPLAAPSIEALEAARAQDGTSLGFIKPNIRRFLIQPAPADWTPEQAAKLSQLNFLLQRPSRPLEKVPFDFRYEFTCDHTSCSRTHIMKVSDWEIYQAYRSWRQRYGNKWRTKFEERFVDDMIQKKDTHFYVGTLFRHPHRWTITGLFYPPA